MISEKRYAEAILALEMLKQEEYLDYLGVKPPQALPTSGQHSAPVKLFNAAHYLSKPTDNDCPESEQQFQALRENLAKLAARSRELQALQQPNNKQRQELDEISKKLECSGSAYQR